MTRQEALQRLDQIAEEIARLKTALQDEGEAVSLDSGTDAFLQKCQGWEDTRTPEEIIADIYQARTTSSAAAAAFSEKRS